MRYMMLTVLAAAMVSSMIGCSANSKDTTSHNPITGTTTHTHSTDVNSNN